MKPPTVFLGEMTTLEVEAFLADHDTVIVPVGSTEQHGPHGPLLTDALVPTEVARRAAPRLGAVVAPTIPYSLSYPHAGFAGLVHIRIPTFMSLIEDLCVALTSIGFRRVVFLNGHYDNTYAIAYACANAADRLPAGSRCFPVNYWDGMTPDEAAEFFDPANGLHANKGETSAVLAINPDLVDMELANREFPPFPETESGPAVHTAFFFSSPGSVYRATTSGTWGDARASTAEFGELYLEVVTNGDDPPHRRHRAHPPGDAWPLVASAAGPRLSGAPRPCPAPTARPPRARSSGSPQTHFAFGSIAIELLGGGLSAACEVAARPRIRPPKAILIESCVLAGSSERRKPVRAAGFDGRRTMSMCAFLRDAEPAARISRGGPRGRGRSRARGRGGRGAGGAALAGWAERLGRR